MTISRFASYRLALACSAIFHAIHLWSLPLVMSPDGLTYVRLSGLFNTASFSAQWHYLVMPLYPLMLRGSFAILGENATAALLPGTVLGFIGIWALSHEIYAGVGPVPATAAVVVLTLYPTLTAYEHTVLTEPGTFCVLALMTALCLRVVRVGLRVPAVLAIATVLTVGYLYRTPTLVLIPVALLAVLVVWAQEITSPSMHTAAIHVRGAVAVVAIVAFPLLAMHAWLADGRAERVRSTFNANVLTYFSQQGIVPDARHATFPSIATVRPRQYLTAAGRTLLVFGGVPDAAGDNLLFASNVLSLSVTNSKCICTGTEAGPFYAHFDRGGRRTPVHYLLKILQPLYGPLVLSGWIATVVGLFVGMSRRDPQFVVIAGVPFAFAFAHAAILFDLDRFAVPVYALVLANLCVIVPRLVSLWRPAPDVIVLAACEF